MTDQRYNWSKRAVGAFSAFWALFAAGATAGALYGKISDDLALGVIYSALGMHLGALGIHRGFGSMDFRAGKFASRE